MTTETCSYISVLQDDISCRTSLGMLMSKYTACVQVHVYVNEFDFFTLFHITFKVFHITFILCLQRVFSFKTMLCTVKSTMKINFT